MHSHRSFQHNPSGAPMRLMAQSHNNDIRNHGTPRSSGVLARSCLAVPLHVTCAGPTERLRNQVLPISRGISLLAIFKKPGIRPQSPEKLSRRPSQISPRLASKAALLCSWWQTHTAITPIFCTVCGDQTQLSEWIVRPRTPSPHILCQTASSQSYLPFARHSRSPSAGLDPFPLPLFWSLYFNFQLLDVLEAVPRDHSARRSPCLCFPTYSRSHCSSEHVSS
ncbi:hypothetical protein BD779DRAFT_358085 [Infundibulicybe gibba]|nr:hypothetical protein BD779DRAFT_358085 [Infundibulicybe gibba]